MSELQPHQSPVPVSLDVVWQGSSARHDARMSEISMEGCFIDTKMQGRSVGEVVEFKVHMPGGPWVSLQGELISQEYPIGFGLHFTDLTEGDRRLLSQVVAAHGGVPAETPSDGTAVDPVAAGSPIYKSGDKPDVASQAAADRGRILLADDDEMTLRMLKAIAQAEGYGVVDVKDGREALGVLQRDADFKAAIFDMKMPFLEGLDLILYMKQDERLRRIPVGMITGEQDPKVWDDSVAAGASVFLPKPFSPPQVQMMLRMLASKAG